MRLICGLALVSLLSWGQDTAPKVERRLIQIKYVEANRVQRLVTGLAGGHGDLYVEADDRLHYIAVRGPAEAVAALEEAVKRLDVPTPDFELTVYLMSTAAQGSDQVPEALESTAKQLHGVFAYKGYQLLESFVLRGSDGKNGSASGTISKDGKNSQYSFRYNRSEISGGAPRVVSLHDLHLDVRYFTGVSDKNGNAISHDTALSTDVDARDGQKIVVGKSDLNYGASPLILVVTAKVME